MPSSVQVELAKQVLQQKCTIAYICFHDFLASEHRILKKGREGGVKVNHIVLLIILVVWLKKMEDDLKKSKNRRRPQKNGRRPQTK